MHAEGHSLLTKCTPAESWILQSKLYLNSRFRIPGSGFHVFSQWNRDSRKSERQDRFSTIFLDSSQESVQSYRGCVSIYFCTKSFTFISSFGCHSPENMSVVKSYFAFSRQVATKQHQITILAVYYFMTAARSSFRNFIQLSLCIKTNDSSTTAEQQLTKL